jgi:hypothetical protein
MINISISGLRQDLSYVCLFGDEHISAQAVDNSTLTCASPQMDHSQNLVLVVKSINASAELMLMSNPVLFTIDQPIKRIPFTQSVHQTLRYQAKGLLTCII